MLAVSFALLWMSSLVDHVIDVVGATSPKEILQLIVGAVGVRMVASLFSWLWETNKGLEDKVVNPLLFLGLWEVNTQIPLAKLSWLNDFSVRTSHSSLIGNLVPFPPHRWQPSLFSHPLSVGQ